MRTFHETIEYENMAVPGTYAALMVIGDDDGPHLMFRSGDTIIVDLALPVCEAAIVNRALDRSIEVAMRAAEQLTPGFTEAALEDPAEYQLEPSGRMTTAQLEPGRMTPYGRPDPDPVSVPAHQHVEHRQIPGPAPRPVATRPPRAIHPGQT